MMIQSTTTSTPSGVGILQIGCVHVSYLYRICKRVCGWKQNPDSLQNFLPRFSPALSVTLMASSCQDGNKYSGDPLQPIRIAGIMQGLNYMTVYMHVSNHMQCNVIKLGCKSRSSLWVCIKHVISWNNMGRCTTQLDTQLADHAANRYLSWLGPTRSPSVRGSVTRPAYGGYIYIQLNAWILLAWSASVCKWLQTTMIIRLEITRLASANTFWLIKTYQDRCRDYVNFCWCVFSSLPPNYPCLMGILFFEGNTSVWTLNILACCVFLNPHQCISTT